MTKPYDVLVIGGGPAGLAAAVAAHDEGARVMLIEREGQLGGILKQCIHDGFGLMRFKEKLTGPEYAERYIDMLLERAVPYMVGAFLTGIKKENGLFCASVVSEKGVDTIFARALILATGCRERTARQIFIGGTRPAGVLTAGAAQHLTNLMGERVTRRCVILGSGDIGLIMARRLTLEGAKVLGVYEVRPTPSGLERNIMQCLKDYDIPLYLSHTVTRVFGHERLEGVEVAEVDERGAVIEGTARRVDCDALILSVGLIPENEIALSLGVPLDERTKGPQCDTDLMTPVDGVFTCGNAMHVNDLVDYVSQSGERAGKAAARYGKTGEKKLVPMKVGKGLLYLTPTSVNIKSDEKQAVFYFRAARPMKRATLRLSLDGRTLFEKKLRSLRPPEMQTVSFSPESLGLSLGSAPEWTLEEETP